MSVAVAHDQTRRALLLMALAVPLFALMDAGLKLLSLHYPVLQVAALRALSSLPFIFAWAAMTIGVPGLLRGRWGMHLLRAGLGVGMMMGFIYGLRSLPLSTAYAITFVYPLLVTALAVPLLAERVGPRRWIAIGIGLLGVLVVLRPTGEGVFTTAGLAVLLAAVCFAFNVITVRVQTRTDSTQAMVFWMMAIMAAVAALLSFHEWRAIQWQHLWIVAGIGVTGSLAQILFTEAIRRGEASLVAPLEYSALVWAVILDVTLWGVLPDAVTWIGAAIIVASGLYLMRRERVASDPDAAAGIEAPRP